MEDQAVQLHLLTAQEEAQRSPPPPDVKFGNVANAPYTSLTQCAWELGGIILSATLIGALVIVLRCYEGNREPAWDHMSLNTLVAWISTAARACILFLVSQALGQLKWVWFASERRPLEDLGSFDSASRGFLGSLALIYRVRARHFAVVGCLAMVLAVGFDPFLQNLVHYVSRDVVDVLQPCYLGNTTMYNSVGPLMGGDFFYIDPILKANVYSALFGQGTNQPWATPQYTCTTGNCIWDPIANLAMRALCANVTSHLTRNCSYNSGDNTSYERCNVTLGDALSVFYLSTGGQADLMGVTTVNSGAAVVYQNASFPVVQYILANGSNSNPNAGGGVATTIDNSTQFIATECSLEPLVRSVKPSVSLGVYQETILAEWAVRNKTMPSEAGQLSFTPNWTNASGLGLISPGEVFGLGHESWDAMVMFLEQLFSGYVSAGSDVFQFEPTETYQYATADTLEALFYGNFSGNCDIEDQLTCAMNNMAMAISKTIRDAAFSSGAQYDLSSTVSTNITTGRTINTASFVAVRWEWLILPLLVWLLATVSWIGTAWRSDRSVPGWKNDILPLLFLYRPAKTDQSLGDDLNLIHQQQIRVKLDQSLLDDA